MALSETQQRAADAGLKAMMPIAGRPFLDYLLSALADAGIREVALVVAPDHAALQAVTISGTLHRLVSRSALSCSVRRWEQRTR